MKDIYCVVNKNKDIVMVFEQQECAVSFVGDASDFYTIMKMSCESNSTSLISKVGNFFRNNGTLIALLIVVLYIIQIFLTILQLSMV